jgi:hypothetical protein
MKILLRSLLILFVFALLAGGMVISVNGASTVAIFMGLLDDSETERQELPETISGEGDVNDLPERGDEPGASGFFPLAGRWILSMGKNIFMISVLVIAIVFPKNVLKRVKKTAQE